MRPLSLLSDLHRKNEQVQMMIKLGEELTSVKADTNSIYSKSINKRFDSIFVSDAENKYSKGYREYLQQERTLLGCSPFIYPDGYVVKIPCTSIQVHLPPGRAEDMLLFLCHNHPLFRCFYFMDGSKLGAHGSRILFIGKDVVVFVLYQFSNMLLQYYTLDGKGLDNVVNLFIITPSAVSVGLLLKYLYTCPFTETVEFQRRYAKYQSAVLLLGRLAIIPIIFIMVSSLIMACILSSNRHVVAIIVEYCINVQLYGILVAMGNMFLLFVDGYYYQLSLLGILDVVCIGKLYKERVMVEQLVVDVDYAYRIHSYFFGLIRVQKILNRDDAIKVKWIKVGGDVTQYDIELKGTSSSDIVVQNPLVSAGANNRNSVSFTFDTIHVDEEKGFVNRLSDEYRDPLVANRITTANPIHSPSIMGCSATNTGNWNRVSSRHPSNGSTLPVADGKDGDDDAALYLEYQSHQIQHDDAAYAMADNDKEEMITFEEWKSRRKQFKQGTRGSFVQAFQLFEEREQLLLLPLGTDVTTSSASAKNTMHLHKSTAKKSVLASKINKK